MRNKIFQESLKGMAFALHPSSMSALMAFANSETPRSEQNSITVAHNSVEYEAVGSTAVISIDGAMYKKDIGGMCSNVASYDQMIKAIDKAEADSVVKTILFRVDTGGGAVDGADEVGERIFTSSKKTITLYENMGASGGIWVFSASDEVYATETTMLGSIGVVVSYLESNDKEGERIDIVSKNAQNKRCSLNGDCQDKIQSMLDSYEDIFYSRVMRNTGFSAEQIQENFNNGDMIFASQAKEDGFVKEIITFDKLMKSLNSNSGSTFVPTASESESLISDNSNETIQGAEMEFNQENFDILVESREHLNGNIKVLNTKVQEGETALEALQVNMDNMEAKATEAVNGLASFKAETTTRMEEATSTGVSLPVALAMINADSPEASSKLALDAKESDGQTHQTPSAPVVGAWDKQKFNRGQK